MRKLAHIDTNGKEAQRAAMTARKSVLRSNRSTAARKEASEAAAAPFLDGMQTPPPRQKDRTPHWESR